MARFTDIFLDITKESRKIPKENYLQTGIYPIIDQGQEYIAGFSNDKIASFLKIKKKTVEMRLYRANLLLRKNLKGQGDV